MAMQKLNFYIAAILNPLNDKKCEYFGRGLMVVEKRGHQSKIKDLLPLSKGLKRYAGEMNEENTIEYKSSAILPGFFDMHFHWVQDDVRQMPKDSLLEWLQKYTFPTEMKFAEMSYAGVRAREFFKRLISVGTVGGACYSSIHEHAVEAALKEVKGDFVIGNVLMNMNSPEELTQSEGEALSLTERMIKKYGSRYCFTPRFAITTTPKVMKEGSSMADKAGCFKQTHLAETLEEIEFALSLYRQLPGFEKVKSYTDIYKKTGMLGRRSLMGHGIYLSEEELKILKVTGTSLIHCPTSNAPLKENGLGSGLFDFRKVERAKVKWALGSDIGGGPFLSMFDVMRSFVEQNTRKKIKGAVFVKALYRATLAGAEIFGLQKTKGNLSPKKEANFIVVPFKGRPPKSAEELLKKIVMPHRESRQNYDHIIEAVYLNGESVFSKSHLR